MRCVSREVKEAFPTSLYTLTHPRSLVLSMMDRDPVVQIAEGFVQGLLFFPPQPLAKGAFLRGSGLNLATGRFTAPVSGIYQFSANVHIGECCSLPWHCLMKGCYFMALCLNTLLLGTAASDFEMAFGPGLGLTELFIVNKFLG